MFFVFKGTTSGTTGSQTPSSLITSQVSAAKRDFFVQAGIALQVWFKARARRQSCIRFAMAPQQTRKLWADMHDSSTETLAEPAEKPRLFVANSFDSYCETPDWDLAENPKGALSMKFASLGRTLSDQLMADAEQSQPQQVSPQQPCSQLTLPERTAAASCSSSMTTQPSALNAQAPEFVPDSMISTSGVGGQTGAH